MVLSSKPGASPQHEELSRHSLKCTHLCLTKLQEQSQKHPLPLLNLDVSCIECHIRFQTFACVLISLFGLLIALQCALQSLPPDTPIPRLGARPAARPRTPRLSNISPRVRQCVLLMSIPRQQKPHAANRCFSAWKCSLHHPPHCSHTAHSPPARIAQVGSRRARRIVPVPYRQPPQP